jgi:hypothetical protein
MAQWILKANGNIVPRRTVRPLQVNEVHSPTEIKKREIFDELIERRWGTSINPPKVKDENESDPNKPHPEDWDYYEDDDEAPQTVPDIEDIVDSKGKLLDQQPAYARLINSEVQLQLGEELHTTKVVQRAIGPAHPRERRNSTNLFSKPLRTISLWQTAQPSANTMTIQS